MSIKLSFALLIGALALAFLLALLLLQRVERLEHENAIASYRRERTTIVERLLELSGQNLRQLANDYSLWDDMVQFVAAPTAEWAEINLEPSLHNFGASHLWVFNPQGGVVWSVPSAATPPAPPPLQAGRLLDLTARQPFPWFFAETAAGLLEVRVAPIQPSNDVPREEPARGWLMVGRVWDDRLLQAFGELNESHASLGPVPEAPALEPPHDNLDVVRPLPNWDGEPIRLLHLVREVPEVAHRLEADRHETHIFVGFGLLVMLLLGIALHSWVVQPLSAIQTSLERNQPSPIAALRKEKHELGQVAQRIWESFEHRQTLEHEVDERRRVEAALRESEATLRGAIEERVRLGRDLHDSVIQSIYAAGLGLAAVRSLLPADPAEADRRLEQVRQTLNETIRDLRAFITGLEPEALERLTLKAAVHALVDRLQTAVPLPVQLEIDEAVAERLSPAARANLLQITREALSNVWRHASATTVQVALAKRGELGELSIVDDGCGFDAALVSGHGRGLVNMAERARAADAALQVESAFGKGTRLRVSFSLSKSSQ